MSDKTHPSDPSNPSDPTKNTGTKVELIECSLQRCAHIHLFKERDKKPGQLFKNSFVLVCPKCGCNSYYTLNAKGQARRESDTSPREINAEDIEPSEKMGLKKRRRILAAKRRALEAAASTPSIKSIPSTEEGK